MSTDTATDSKARVNPYDCLKTPEVQSYFKALTGEKNVVFVTGCARSGTSLMQRCLATLHDPDYFWRENIIADVYRDEPYQASNIVLKRRASCYKYFSLIPPGVKIVHMVRSPKYVFTSRVKEDGDFYMKPDRWIGEYEAFLELEKSRPENTLVVTRYEDLVQDPDAVQATIGSALNLEFDLPFSRYFERNHLDGKMMSKTGLRRDWPPIVPERSRIAALPQDQEDHWQRIRQENSEVLESFCRKFGYSFD